MELQLQRQEGARGGGVANELGVVAEKKLVSRGAGDCCIGERGCTRSWGLFQRRKGLHEEPGIVAEEKGVALPLRK